MKKLYTRTVPKQDPMTFLHKIGFMTMQNKMAIREAQLALIGITTI